MKFNFNLSKKIALGYIVLLLLIFALGLLTFNSLAENRKTSENLINVASPSLTQANKLLVLINNSKMLAKSWVFIEIHADTPSKREFKRLFSDYSKIKEGLDTLSLKWNSEEAEKYSVTRKEERKLVIRPGTRIGFTYLSLSCYKAHHLIEPFIVKYPVIKREPSTLFDHPGEEFLLVLEGKIDFVYGKEKIRLRAGDAIHFDPSVPHRGQNATSQESECLVIVINEEAIKGTS